MRGVASVRRFVPSRDVPVVLVADGVLMTAAWFVLPRTWLFSWTGPIGYAVALSAWTLGDVLITNIFGSDPQRTVAALADPAVGIPRMLRTRVWQLWALVAPLCVAISLVVGVDTEHWLYTAAALTVVALVPLGALPLCGMVGLVVPYHVRPLRWRWERRHAVAPLVRWALLVLLPFWLYPVCCAAIIAGPLWIWKHGNGKQDSVPVAVLLCLTCVALTAVICALCWRVAMRCAVRLAVARRTALIEYLTDPAKG